MSKVVTTTVLPDVAGGSVTLGGTGDSVVVTGNDIRANVMQDAGGNAVFTSNGSGVLSGLNAGLKGAMKLIQSQTASNQASISFTTGIDSTYDVYIFKFINMNPATDRANLQFQVNATDGADYNDSLFTSTAHYASNYEATYTGAYTYTTTHSQAQAAGFQTIGFGMTNDADAHCSGEMHLFSPSSTTYVKNFFCRVISMFSDSVTADGPFDCFVCGYINDTTAIDDIRFKMSAGNFDGTIKMYGISKS